MTDASQTSAAPTLPPGQRVGFALVGLGRLTLDELLPAFARCRQARAVALVSGSREKMLEAAREHGIAPEACLHYDDFERLAERPDVQAVFIVLPNHLHREYAERAAAIGLHVLCEKPMATSAEDARAMLRACEAADVKLMIAYRCQYQAHNLHAQRLVREQTYGRLVGMTAVNTQVSNAANEQWRLDAGQAGGGALPDIGLYCINAARFLTGQEPVEVQAMRHSPPDDPAFEDIEQTVALTLRFASGLLVNALASYGAYDNKGQQLLFERAWVDMPNAYAYVGQRLRVTVPAREAGASATRATELALAPDNAFAAEIDHFADCVRTGREPRTPGAEGVRDHVVIEALYESARSGRPVALPPLAGIDATRGPAVGTEVLR